MVKMSNTRVVIQLHDLTEEKQQELIEAILEHDDTGNYLHEIYIECRIDEDGVTFE